MDWVLILLIFSAVANLSLLSYVSSLKWDIDYLIERQREAQDILDWLKERFLPDNNDHYY